MNGGKCFCFFNVDKLMVKRKNDKWTNFLDQSLTDLLSKDVLLFKNLKPSMLTGDAGVYLLTFIQNAKTELPYYVGRTKNLRRRLYTNHLMGSTANARLKKYLVADDTEDLILNATLAKTHIREHCGIRWIYENDTRIRGALEGYFTAMLFPKYGIAEEH